MTLKTMTKRELLEAALIGLDLQKLTLEARILQIQALLDHHVPRKPVALAMKETMPRKKKKRRKLTAAGRKAISEASKRRWEAVRAAKAKGRR